MEEFVQFVNANKITRRSLKEYLASHGLSVIPIDKPWDIYKITDIENILVLTNFGYQLPHDYFQNAIMNRRIDMVKFMLDHDMVTGTFGALIMWDDSVREVNQVGSDWQSELDREEQMLIQILRSFQNDDINNGSKMYFILMGYIAEYLHEETYKSHSIIQMIFNCFVERGVNAIKFREFLTHVDDPERDNYLVMVDMLIAGSDLASLGSEDVNSVRTYDVLDNYINMYMDVETYDNHQNLQMMFDRFVGNGLDIHAFRAYVVRKNRNRHNRNLIWVDILIREENGEEYGEYAGERDGRVEKNDDEEKEDFEFGKKSKDMCNIM